ncbi:ATP-binding cassette domain-containing protein [Sinomonas sp. ASV486]|uniref:ABC transporter ATP-binding protein n=1 Tax=Sinomonas puerhi TaxID=3238584 RepID=A0AB39L2A8_9MICC|nr:ATP-binding cassette domain-containing protein [Sinomonas sp. ASV486]MDQ4491654.1 ATP-binding cassette domain-containing protein [Sinomonas sp. ASV486]
MSGNRPAGVKARGWGWRHAGRKAFAVDGVDLDIAPGERILLLGASGAGKSTLLHALAGVLGAAEEGEERGQLTIDGVPAPLARGRAGLVLQDPDGQIAMARVGDEVAFGCENLAVPREEIWPRVHRALDDVGLAVPLDHPTSSLSGGQKQRLALAGILAMEPGLVLLDEPTANLDPAGVDEVRDAVRRSLDRTGATLVVVEHRVSVWSGLVDRVVVLDAAGGVAADGTPDAVLAEPDARRRLAAMGVWVPGWHPLTGEGPVRPLRESRSDWQPGAAGEAAASGAGNDGSGSHSSGPRAANGHRSGSTPSHDALLAAGGLAVGRARKAAPVVAGIDLALHEGRSVSVTGPNGAGKSTLALTLAGLLPALGGRLEALAPLARGAGPSPHRWRSSELVTRIGSVFQEPEHQFLTPRVIDELEFGPRRVARMKEAQVRAAVDPLLERLRLTQLAGANPFTLSGGEKRRLSVATMLATSPRILMLDEPTFGQDALTWAELVKLLAELLGQGTSLLSVTHDEDFTAALSDSVYRVDSGRAALVGAAA